MSNFWLSLAIRGEVLTNHADGTPHWFGLGIERGILD